MNKERTRESAPERKEQNKKPEIIIDFIRHEKTPYKEFLEENPKFDPAAPDFKLDEKHLDLTDEGIRGMVETAEQLARAIDKKNEVVFLVTSPAHRAQSSILLIEKILREKGITILNPAEQIKQATQLQEIRIHQQKDPRFMEKSFKAHEEYFSDPANANKSPDVYHAEIAAKMGMEFLDIYQEDYDHLDKRFWEFFRRIMSTDRWLPKQTQKSLGDKRIRVICLTHGGVSTRFLRYFFKDRPELEKGQILEINPDSLEDQLSDQPTKAHVILYEKDDSPKQEKDISINFPPDTERPLERTRTFADFGLSHLEMMRLLKQFGLLGKKEARGKLQGKERTYRNIAEHSLVAGMVTDVLMEKLVEKGLLTPEQRKTGTNAALVHDITKRAEIEQKYGIEEDNQGIFLDPERRKQFTTELLVKHQTSEQTLRLLGLTDLTGDGTYNVKNGKINISDSPEDLIKWAIFIADYAVAHNNIVSTFKERFGEANQRGEYNELIAWWYQKLFGEDKFKETAETNPSNITIELQDRTKRFIEQAEKQFKELLDIDQSVNILDYIKEQIKERYKAHAF